MGFLDKFRKKPPVEEVPQERIKDSDIEELEVSDELVEHDWDATPKEENDDSIDVEINYRGGLLAPTQRDKEEQYQDILATLETTANKSMEDILVTIDRALQEEEHIYDVFERIESQNIPLLALVALELASEEDIAAYQLKKERGLQPDYPIGISDTTEEMENPSFQEEVIPVSPSFGFNMEPELSETPDTPEATPLQFATFEIPARVEETTEMMPPLFAENTSAHTSPFAFAMETDTEVREINDVTQQAEETPPAVSNFFDSVQLQMDDTTAPATTSPFVFLGSTQPEQELEEPIPVLAVYEEEPPSTLSGLGENDTTETTGTISDLFNPVSPTSEPTTSKLNLQFEGYIETQEDVKEAELKTKQETSAPAEDVSKDLSGVQALLSLATKLQDTGAMNPETKIKEIVPTITPEQAREKLKKIQRYKREQAVTEKRVFLVWDGLTPPKVEGYNITLVTDIKDLNHFGLEIDDLLLVTNQVPEALQEELSICIQNCYEDTKPYRLATIPKKAYDSPYVTGEVAALSQEGLDVYYQANPIETDKKNQLSGFQGFADFLSKSTE